MMVIVLILGLLLGVGAGVWFTRRPSGGDAVAQALDELRWRKRALLDSLTDLVWFKDAQGRYQSVNQPFLEFLGKPLDQIAGKTDAMLFPPEMVAHHAEQDGQVLAQGVSVRVEKCMRGHWYETILNPVRDDNGNIAGLVGVCREITARKLAEARVQQLLSQQRAILDGANYSIVATDPDGLITTFNRAAERMLGYAAEEIVGKQTPAIFHDANEVRQHAMRLSAELGQEVSPGFETFVAKARLRGEPDENEWTYVRKDGTRIPVRLSVTALRDADGMAAGFLGVAQDVSQQKAYESALRASEAGLRQAQAVAHIGSWHLDMERGWLDWSDETYRIFGVTHGQPLSYEAFLQRVHPDDVAMLDAAWGAALRGEPYDLEHRILVDGEIRWVHEKAQLEFRDGVAVAGTGTVQDITARKLSETEQRRLLEILDSSPDIVSQSDAVGNLLYMNPAGRRLLGWQEGDRAEHYRIADMHAPEMGQRILQEYLPQVLVNGSGVFDTTFRTRQGRDIPVSQLILVHKDAMGQVTHYSTIARDMTEQKYLLERLALSDKVFTFTDEAIMITDQSNRIVSVNQAFTRLTGYTEEEVRGQNPRLLSSGRHDSGFYSEMWASLLGQGNWQGEIWDRRKDGTVYPKWININAIQDADSGEVVNFVAVFSDISQRKQQEEKIRHIAFHDALTGLPNRLLFHDRLHQALAEGRRDEQRVALMFLDLDRFKDINDTMGHHVGDLLLKEVAGRIAGCVREIDTVARLGGDEFVVILSRVRDTSDPAAVAEKILTALAVPVEIENQKLFVGSSVGIAVYPDDAEDATSLMKSADSALYHAKDLGRGNYQFYTPAMNQAALERMRIERALRLALERGELCLHYQPKIDIEHRTVVGCEALLRWQHPEWGMVSPATFIPVAEETGLIVSIGEWVMREAARQAAQWACEGVAVRVAVNLSGRQFNDPNLVRSLQALLAEYRIPAASYEIEITESTLMDGVSNAAQILRDIKAQGVLLSIDDFGTGYSSLAYLKTFEIDKLKIDQSFIRDIHSDPNDAAIVRAVVSLAHELGLQVVAEGVEDEKQLHFLAGLGCDIAQGYYFSRPLPADEFRAFLQKSRS